MVGGIIAVIVFALSLIVGVNEVLRYTSDTSEKRRLDTFFMTMIACAIGFTGSINYVYLGPSGVADRFLDALEARDRQTMRDLACNNTDLAAFLDDPRRNFIQGVSPNATQTAFNRFFFPITNDMNFRFRLTNDYVPDRTFIGQLSITPRNLSQFCISNLELE